MSHEIKVLTTNQYCNWNKHWETFHATSSLNFSSFPQIMHTTTLREHSWNDSHGTNAFPSNQYCNWNKQWETFNVASKVCFLQITDLIILQQCFSTRINEHCFKYRSRNKCTACRSLLGSRQDGIDTDLCSNQLNILKYVCYIYSFTLRMNVFKYIFCLVLKSLFPNEIVVAQIVLYCII